MQNAELSAKKYWLSKLKEEKRSDTCHETMVNPRLLRAELLRLKKRGFCCLAAANFDQQMRTLEATRKVTLGVGIVPVVSVQLLPKKTFKVKLRCTIGFQTNNSPDEYKK
jgi:hypothetical protein